MALYHKKAAVSITLHRNVHILYCMKYTAEPGSTERRLLMYQESLRSMLLRCINAEYHHTDQSGDYAIQAEPPFLYLLFEWSDGHEDWRNNLSFSARKVHPHDPKMSQWYAHRGFLKVWQAMRGEVMEKITQMIMTDLYHNITCVGYSHGAALSLLATEELSRHWGQTLRVEGYGFGCPRVVWGNLPDAVRLCLSNFHTIRNIPDLVTHLPPAAFGFRHINLESIGEKGKYSPIKAHTSQAYLDELRQAQQPVPTASSTSSAVLETKLSKVSSDRWVFRSVYPVTPRR